MAYLTWRGLRPTGQAGGIDYRRSVTWPVRDLGTQGAPVAFLVTVYGVTGQSILAEHEEVTQLTIGSRRLGPTSLLFADLHAFETLDLIQRHIKRFLPAT